MFHVNIISWIWSKPGLYAKHIPSGSVNTAAKISHHSWYANGFSQSPLFTCALGSLKFRRTACILLVFLSLCLSWQLKLRLKILLKSKYFRNVLFALPHDWCDGPLFLSPVYLYHQPIFDDITDTQELWRLIIMTSLNNPVNSQFMAI